MDTTKALAISYAKVALDNESVVFNDKVKMYLGLINLKYGMSVFQGKSKNAIRNMFYDWLYAGRY